MSEFDEYLIPFFRNLILGETTEPRNWILFCHSERSEESVNIYGTIDSLYDISKISIRFYNDQKVREVQIQNGDL